MQSKNVYSHISKVANIYDFFSYITGYRQSIEYFVRQLPFEISAPIKVLDAGCGTGPYTFAILKIFPNAKVTAFDLDKGLVKHLKEKVQRNNLNDRVSVFTADIQGELSEIENEKFDLIITSGVLVYVPHEKTVRNLSRFLVLGGYFFNSPNRDSAWGRFICKLYNCKPYPKEENISVFVKNGFTLVKDIKVPKTPTASFKDAHIFRKNN